MTSKALKNVVKLNNIISVKDFGAVGDGVADDTTACQNAVNHIVSLGGGVVLFPQGSYKLNGVAGADGIVHGIHVPFTQLGIEGASTSVRLQGDGRDTKLIAGTANMFIVRWSTSQGGISDFCFQGNGTSTGLALTAANTTSSAAPAGQSDITHNSFNRLLFGYNREAIFLACTAAPQSGVYYNMFDDIYIYFGQTPVANNGGRGILLKQYAGATGQQNRNVFSNIVMKRLNTGIEINEGDSSFMGVQFEDVTYGTLPNTSPTAIKVNASCQNVKVFNAVSEVSVIGISNAGFLTELYGCLLGVGSNGFGGSAINVFTTIPAVMVGGYEPSAIPQITWGTFLQGNNQIPSLPTGYTCLGDIRGVGFGVALVAPYVFSFANELTTGLYRSGTTTVSVRSNNQQRQWWGPNSVGLLNRYANAEPFAGVKYLSAISNTDNPVVDLLTAQTGTAGIGNSVMIVKVTVFQTEFAAENGNVHVGYAKIQGSGSGTAGTMTVEENLGIANVGTLAWSGRTLQYTANRSGNYDSYGIKVEVGGALLPVIGASGNW